jgi:type IV pilus assembly protein PilQ
MMSRKALQVCAWMGVLLILGGCLASSSPENKSSGKEKEKKEVTRPAEGIATRIARIEAVDDGDGSRVSLYADGQLKYEVFVIDQPPRMLVNFKDVKLASAVQPRNVSLATVKGILPRVTPQQGSQLEIQLTELLADYNIDERWDGLDISLPRPKAIEAHGLKPRLQDVRITRETPGTRIQMVINHDAAQPQVFRVDNPPRLVVDLFGVSSNIDQQTYMVHSPEVKQVQVGAAADKTRLLVDLAQSDVTYRLAREHGTPTLFLTQGSIPGRGASSLEAVDFTRDGGDAIVRLRVNRSDVVVDSKRTGNTLQVDLKSVTAPTHLVRRMDVQDFGGPVSAVDTYPESGNTRVVVRLADNKARHAVIQKGEEILIRLIPLGTQGEYTAGAGTGDIPYTGERISMDFKDIDIQNALRLIADISNLNILLADSVSGTLTMRLVNIPWDQALDLILDAKGLGKYLEGNVLRVAPLGEINQAAQAKLQAEESQKQLEPLSIRMIPVNFAEATAIQGLLARGAGGLELLSERGSITIDNRTNTLIVKDLADRVTSIEDMVRKLDKPTPQVLIEARIVEVSRGNSSALGINWGFNLKDKPDTRWALAPTAADALAVNLNGASGVPRPSMSGGTTTNVNLMPSGSSGSLGFHLGSISPLIDLDIELGAMELAQKAKTISSPRVLTTDNNPAKITQGVNQPYPTQASSGGVTYSYIPATLSLDVTPQVTPDGYITLTVTATNNSLGASTAGGGAPPPINTKEVNTKVLVKNGTTIVLGGIYNTSKSGSTQGVPGFSKVPLLGWLFKNRNMDQTDSELLIFLTPRIIDPR